MIDSYYDGQRIRQLQSIIVNAIAKLENPQGQGRETVAKELRRGLNQTPEDYFEDYFKGLEKNHD